MLLLILLAVLAACNGEGCDKECIEETLEFRQCIYEQVQNTTQFNLQQVDQFGREVIQCFDRDGVKGICSTPRQSLWPSPTESAGINMAGVGSYFSDCVNGSRDAFIKCFKQEMGLQDDCDPPPHRPPPQLTLRPLHFLHGHFFHTSPDYVKRHILALCAGNKEAADKLRSCAMQTARPYLRSSVASLYPLITVCEAKNACSELRPLSPVCQQNSDKGRGAFCQCLQRGKNYIRSDDPQCSRLRSTQKAVAEAQARETAMEVSASQHNQLHHPDHPYNFCEQPNACQELKEKCDYLCKAFSKDEDAAEAQ